MSTVTVKLGSGVEYTIHRDKLRMGVIAALTSGDIDRMVKAVSKSTGMTVEAVEDMEPSEFTDLTKEIAGQFSLPKAS
jgi:hypothetical protein